MRHRPVAVIDLCFGFGNDPSDFAAFNIPSLKHRLHFGGAFRRGCQQHPFLGFRQQHFVGRHSRFAAMHRRQVDADAAPGPGRRFNGRTGQPGGAQILDCQYGAGIHRLQAGFNQRFLQKGIAHLHRGAQFRFRIKGARGQPGGAMNAVAPGVGAGQQQHAAGNAGGGRGQPVFFNEADTHSVDQRVEGIGRVEADFAADVGDADAVAVPRNAAHHAAQKMPVAGAVGGIVQGAETQGIEQRDGAGAHGQDVAHDAANAGGRALEGLHRRGVVVRLHLEHHRQAVAEVHRAGVFGAGRRQHRADAGGMAGMAEQPQ